MSSGDDPLAVEDKTVVSRGRGNREEPPSSSGDRSRNRNRQQTSSPSEATVIATRSLPVPDDDDRTIVAGSASSRDSNPPDGDFSRTVIAADAGPAPYPAEYSPPEVPRVSVHSIHVAGSGPILAAATPILMLLARLQQGLIRSTPNDPAALEADMERFQHDLADAGVGHEDIRKAVYVLCTAADDIIGNLPGHRRRAGLLKRFLGQNDGDVGFFETLNGLLAAPAPHHDLLQTMHACLSLGFKGQYRQRDDAALERVRADIHDTLRYLEGAQRQSSAKTAAIRPPADTKVRALPVWSVLAAVAASFVAVYLALLLLLTGEADRVTGKLETLVPARSAIIERGMDGS